MTLTVLCTGLAEAVTKDEAPEVGGFDLSAGMFGPNVSQWLRDTAKAIDAAAPVAPLSDEVLEDVLREAGASYVHVGRGNNEWRADADLMPIARAAIDAFCRLNGIKS